MHGSGRPTTAHTQDPIPPRAAMRTTSPAPINPEDRAAAGSPIVPPVFSHRLLCTPSCTRSAHTIPLRRACFRGASGRAALVLSRLEISPTAISETDRFDARAACQSGWRTTAWRGGCAVCRLAVRPPVRRCTSATPRFRRGGLGAQSKERRHARWPTVCREGLPTAVGLFGWGVSRVGLAAGNHVTGKVAAVVFARPQPSGHARALRARPRARTASATGPSASGTLRIGVEAQLPAFQVPKPQSDPIRVAQWSRGARRMGARECAMATGCGLRLYECPDLVGGKALARRQACGGWPAWVCAYS